LNYAKVSNRKIWLFNKTTPNVKYISPGDRVIVYVAGRKNKFFSAKFIIDSHLTPNQLDHDTPLEAMLSYNFELQCSIKNLVMWKKPLSIYDVKSYLNFINDPKNWGLFFRQAIKIIDENDYNTIDSKGTVINS
jgi:hypothetical protein